MNQQDAEKLIKKLKESDELPWIEVKDSLKNLPKIGETISAIANSASYKNKEYGYLVWGIEDKTWNVIGTTFSFSELKQGNHDGQLWLHEQLGGQAHWETYEFVIKEKPIVILQVTNCENIPIRFQKIAYIRKTSHNQELSKYPEIEKSIFQKNQNFDWSAQICKELIFADLDDSALETLRIKWSKKEQKDEYLRFSYEEVLEKLLLKRDAGLTFSALLLCGKSEKIAEFMPEAEIRFGWKNDSQKLDFDFNNDWKAPLLKSLDELWDCINARNTRFPFEQGFFEEDIWAFDRRSVREAILNAFAHRNYQERGSIFIEASPQKFIIKSPGRFLSGVSSENILDVQGKWRNRLLMETLGKIGLVERYGHGLDRIFSKSISEGKGTPVIQELSTNNVKLSIPTQVKDKNFILFLQRIEREKQINFDLAKDLVFLDEIRENQVSFDRERKEKFLKLAVLEKTGKGRGTKYLLSHKFYDFIEANGEYTRKKWLAKDQQKEVLWGFFQQHNQGRMTDFRDGLFEGKLDNQQINTLLGELRNENKIYFDGPQKSKSAFWKLKDTKP